MSQSHAEPHAESHTSPHGKNHDAHHYPHLHEPAKFAIIDGNEAVASIAYRVNEVCAIYPITPSSTMAELTDQWASEGKKNIWGEIPLVMEMQSEGGAAGTVHGALQTGALTTTFTASQGLLLMIPNMYKIAGELTPTVFHIAARSLATQGLSIFGDHQDVAAVRQTGFVQLCSASVQEAHDMALIAHAASLEARLPFLHFFDGFRTSHEVSKIEMISDEILRAMIDSDLVHQHRARGLNPDRPFMRGTAQNPDVYFQSRETVNLFYERLPAVVQKHMDRLGEFTGRSYRLFDYYGDPQAENIIVIMGSGAYTVRETVEYLNSTAGGGPKVGVVQVRLCLPFCTESFLKAFPKTVRRLAVLDRTKSPGCTGEPLYGDVITALSEAYSDGRLQALGIVHMPKIVGGRYGLSSKEFTPSMVRAVFAELEQAAPKNHFTIGINDDLTFSSLDFENNLNIEPDSVVRALFFGLGADGTVGANKNTIKIIGEATELYTQAYFVYDSKKSGSQTVSHLRFGPEPIQAPYLIESASFVGCHQFNFIKKIDVLKYANRGATFLLNCPMGPDEVWEELPREVQAEIIEKKH